MTILTIILAILAFGCLVIVHEFGHFMAAKVAGVHVLEFWVGMGPAIAHRKFGETDFKLCILPFGGACVMEGEDTEDDAPGTLAGAPLGWRALILAAGALMNFLLGFVIVLLLILPQSRTANTVIDGFADGFPSQGEAMLMEGDQILRIDGYRILLNADISTALSMGDDTKYDIVVRRNGEKLTLHDVPLEAAEYDGVVRYGIDFSVEDMTFIGKLKNAAFRSYDYGRLVWLSLKQLVTGKVGLNQMSGPVGVTDVLVQTAQSSMMNFFALIAFISINLGVMNLLPLPALDGGRLLFVLIELIARKPVPRKYEGYIHFGGFAALMLLMLYVTWQDIMRLIGAA
ncbi:MAG: RIP metalloprotease RseP [Eubacteriales bacterium]|nr:RIP metalloprotease RseP [Eubacteriales bacterium]